MTNRDLKIAAAEAECEERRQRLLDRVDQLSDMFEPRKIVQEVWESAKVKGAGTTATSDCAGLVGTQPSNLTVEIKWKVTKGSPKLAPSTVTFTSQTGGITGDNHGSFDLTGSVTAGSFMGNPVSAHVETDVLVSDILNACNAKGVKKISFGANGASNASL